MAQAAEVTATSVSLKGPYLRSVGPPDATWPESNLHEVTSTAAPSVPMEFMGDDATDLNSAIKEWQRSVRGASAMLT